MASSVVSAAILDAIKRRAFRAILPSQRGRIHLSIDPEAYEAGHVFHLVDRRIKVEHEAILLFVDEQPDAGWGHPCRYRFHDPRTGALLREETASFPPNVSDPGRPLQEFHAPLARSNKGPRALYEATDWRATLGVKQLGPLREEQERHALLWTSQISNARNVRDLELLWRTLVDVYGFAEHHIHVLCHDGTINSINGDPAIDGWPADGSPFRMKVQAAATKQNLQAAFDALKKSLRKPDLLFLHTNNHGTPEGLCVDKSTVITPQELGAMLSGLPHFDALVVMMQQCYSGAFSGPTLSSSTAARTVFTSAVPADKVSAISDPFCPFTRIWTEGIRGGTAQGAALPADPDANDDGLVSMAEAFQYVRTQDTEGYIGVGMPTRDDPQYADSPAGCGSDVYLGVPSLGEISGIVRGYLEGLAAIIPVPDPDPGPLRDLTPERLRRPLGALAKAIAGARR